jgi:hypothetical protein
VARANEVNDRGRNRICDEVRQKSFSDTRNISREENKPLKIIYVQIWDSWLGDGFYAYFTERNKSGGASPWV